MNNVISERAVRANATATAATLGLPLVWHNTFTACIAVDRKTGKRSMHLPTVSVIGKAFNVDEATASQLVYALMCHEINHDKFTDFDELTMAIKRWEKAGKTVDLKKSISNILEDVFIEGQEELPGRRERIALLAKRAEASGIWGSDENPVAMLQSALLTDMRRRYLGHDLVTAEANAAKAREALGDELYDSVMTVAEDAANKRSTRANCLAAEEIVNILVKAQEEQEQQQQSQNGQSDDQDDDGDEDQDQDGQSGDNQDGDQNDSDGSDDAGSNDSGDSNDQGQKSKAKGKAGDGDAEADDGSESNDSADGSASNDTKADSNAKSDAKGGGRQGKQSVSKGASNDESSKPKIDLKDLLDGKVEWDGELNTPENPNAYSPYREEVMEIEGDVNGAKYRSYMETAGNSNLGSVLAGRIEALLTTEGQSMGRRCLVGNTVNKRALAQVAFNPYVFMTAKPELQLDTSVAIVVDTSGSMACNFGQDAHAMERINAAALCGHAIAEACGSFDVETAIYAFNGSAQLVKPFEQFDTSWLDEPLMHGGCTVTERALELVCGQMLNRTTKRKLVLMVLDGDLNDEHAFEEIVKLYREQGVTVKVILVGDSDDSCLKNASSALTRMGVKNAHINSPNAMADAMMDALASEFVSEDYV